MWRWILQCSVLTVSVSRVFECRTGLATRRVLVSSFSFVETWLMKTSRPVTSSPLHAINDWNVFSRTRITCLSVDSRVSKLFRRRDSIAERCQSYEPRWRVLRRWWNRLDRSSVCIEESCLVLPVWPCYHDQRTESRLETGSAQKEEASRRQPPFLSMSYFNIITIIVGSLKW